MAYDIKTGSGMEKKYIDRAMNRIRYELVTIEEEGFITPGNWYAIDRIACIRDICAELIKGNPDACISDGIGHKPEYFDEDRT